VLGKSKHNSKRKDVWYYACLKLSLMKQANAKAKRISGER
jgi:hypothetical protein